MVVIELYRKSATRPRCKTLTEYVEEATKGMVDTEVRYYDFKSKEAQERGITGAPALVIDGKLIAENPPKDEIHSKLNPDEIKKLLREGS